jgi:ADP-dependent phosphofructokinase/glucokinase
VQRGEHEVARLGDGERGLDGLEVAHLAHEHDVRVLAQHVLERLLEAARVEAHLALVDHRELVRVQVLDRVFDR